MSRCARFATCDAHRIIQFVIQGELKLTKRQRE